MDGLGFSRTNFSYTGESISSFKSRFVDLTVVLVKYKMLFKYEVLLAND